MLGGQGCGSSGAALHSKKSLLQTLRTKLRHASTSPGAGSASSPAAPALEGAPPSPCPPAPSASIDATVSRERPQLAASHAAHASAKSTPRERRCRANDARRLASTGGSVRERR